MTAQDRPIPCPPACNCPADTHRREDRPTLGILAEPEPRRTADGRTPEETIALIREECGDGTQPGNSYGGGGGDFVPPSGGMRE